MNKKQYNVETLVNGRKTREYQKDGMTFIEGREGTQYEIRVTNNSYKRIVASITVDGRSVLTDDKDEDSGYIINAHDSIKIKGFRLNEDKVSSFVFSKKGDSRAQKRFGYAKDCGVIGVRIYPEKQLNEWLNEWNRLFKKSYPIPNPIYPTLPSIPTPTPVWTDYTGTDYNDNDYSINGDVNNMDATYAGKVNYYNPNCFRSSNEVSLNKNTFDLGTSMGDDIKSPVELVDFERDELDATFEIYYATRKSLEANKITERPKQQVYIPKAFCKKV